MIARGVLLRRARFAVEQRTEKLFKFLADSGKAAPYPQLSRIVSCFQDERAVADVLFFGDSVLERYSRDDGDRRMISDFVQEGLAGSRRVLAVSQSGATFSLYYEWLRVLRAMPGRPGILIVPINLRTFSPQLDLHPLYQFDRERKAIGRYLDNPSAGVPAFVAGEPSQEAMAAYRAEPMDTAEKNLKTIGAFEQLIAQRPKSAKERRRRARAILVFHYCFLLPAGHPKLDALEQVLAIAREMGLKTLLYVTPINCQAGLQLVGGTFQEMVRKQVQVIGDRVGSRADAQQLLFRDWSAFLPADAFFSKRIANEHLNEKGRGCLAGMILESLESWLAQPAAVRAGA